MDNTNGIDNNFRSVHDDKNHHKIALFCEKLCNNKN